MDAEQTFTQADVDRIVKNRLAREQTKFDQHIAELTERLAEHEATETPPAVTDTELAEAQAAARQSALELQRVRINAEIQVEATKQRAVDPEAVAVLLDPSAIEYDEDGRASNIDRLVGAVLKDRPYLNGAPGKVTSVDQGARGGSYTSEQYALWLMQAEPAKFDKMVSTGQIPRDIFAG